MNQTGAADIVTLLVVVIFISVIFITGVYVGQEVESVERVSGIINIFNQEQEQDNEEVITNFADCIAAGYPAMESWPRQCMTTDGQIFREGCTMDEDCIYMLDKCSNESFGGKRAICIDSNCICVG